MLALVKARYRARIPTKNGKGITLDTGSPFASLAGVLLLVDLGLLDVTLAFGMITAPSAGPPGLTAELVLIPLEILSVGLTVYGAQMAATVSTDPDPPLLNHGFVPDFLPYEP